MSNFNIAPTNTALIETDMLQDLTIDFSPDLFVTEAQDENSNIPLTDKRGNLLPVQTTDLREVPDWVHEPSVRRFVELDVPKAITEAYRRLRPADWSDRVPGMHGASSHRALAALAVGGGWKSFMHYAVPRINAHGGPFDWEHYK